MKAADDRAVRLGIVGAGLVVERGYLPALASLDEIRILAVADPDGARRTLVPGAASYADLDQMLTSEQLDGVLICSPPRLHLEHATRCAEAGLPALVEKPPGVSGEEARSLAKLHPAPSIGFNRRFARGLPIGRRALPDPARITMIFDAPGSDWEARGVRDQPLLDLGCHLVDMCRWLTGANVLAARAVPGSAGRARFELELTGGLRLFADCGAADCYRELIDMRGRLGDARAWRWPEPLHRQLTARLARRPPALIDTWRAQLRSFAGAVRGGPRGRLAPAHDAVEVMAALDAVATSAAGGYGWIVIPASSAVR